MYRMAILSLGIFILLMPLVASGQQNTVSSEPASIELVFVKGGCFDMGDTFGGGEADEKPVHNVCVSDFSIGKYEVTVGQFKEFADTTGYRTEAEKGDGCYYWTGSKAEKDRNKNWRNPGFTQTDSHPVVCVSWNDTSAFLEWVNRQSKKSYRLPTEAEWEYTARSSGKKEKFSGLSRENQLSLYANFCDTNCTFSHKTSSQNDGYEYTAPVGTYLPNGLGLYDMTGNVWEWVSDRYGDKYYAQSPEDNPKGPSSGYAMVLRGGSWGTNPRLIRASTRNGNSPSGRNINDGFRVASSPR